MAFVHDDPSESNAVAAVAFRADFETTTFSSFDVFNLTIIRSFIVLKHNPKLLWVVRQHPVRAQKH